MKALTNLMGVFMGLLLMIIAGLLEPALAVPGRDGVALVDLPTTGQLPALLLVALTCGARVGLMTAVAYLAFGLTQYPVFHTGGGLGYILQPGFGYLLGFIPAAWLVGRFGQQSQMNDPLNLWFSCLAGVLVVQICGGLNLLLGTLAGRWEMSLPQLFYSYWLVPFLLEITMACLVAMLATMIRRLLLVR